jgi:hypothetical protein
VEGVKGEEAHEARVSDTSVPESGQLGSGDWKARYKWLCHLTGVGGKDFALLCSKELLWRAYPAERCLKSSEADFLSRFRRALRVFGSLTFPTRIRFSSSRKKKLAPSLPAKVLAERAAGCRQVKYCRRTWFCSACTSRFENAPQGRISASTEGTLRTVDSRLQPASAGRNDGR